jgi:hypothetical protein
MLARLCTVAWLSAGSVLALAAPASGAGWLPPVVVGQSATTDDASPAVAGAPDGSVVVAWVATLPGGKKAVRVATRGPSGAFAPEDTLPAGGSAITPAELHVAMNARGDAAVAWRAESVVKVSMRPSGATFGAPVDIPSAPESPDDVVLGIDGSGNATVGVDEYHSSYDGSCPNPYYREFLRFVAYPVALAGTVGPLQYIYVPNSECFGYSGSIYEPSLAVNARGDAVAAVTNGATPAGVRVISRSLAGGMFDHQTAYDGTSAADVAIAPNGRYVVGLRNGTQMAAIAGIAGSPPGAIQMLSTSPPSAVDASATVDGGGTGTIAWQADTGADAWQAFARGLSAGGTPGAALPALSPAIPDAAAPHLRPKVAASGSGPTFVVWRSVDSASGHYEIDAADRPQGGAFGAPVRISGDTGQDAKDGVVAAADTGAAMAAFTRFDGSANRIYVSQFDALPPVLSSADAPATATAGAESAFAAVATDDWGPVTIHWDFGDGAAADGPAVTHAFAAAGNPTVTVTATDGAGNQASTTRSVVVAAALPVVSAVAVSPSRFAVGQATTALTARRAPRGTRIRFTLAAPAAARLTFQHPARGRRTHGRCAKPSHRLRKAKRCTRYVKDGKALTRANLGAGAQTVAFSGRIGRKALHRGRHRVVVSATGAQGATSTGHPARFTIVRG